MKYFRNPKDVTDENLHWIMQFMC